MTNNQIEYWKNMENKRHNIAMEQLTGEQLSESIRHNQASEAIGYAQAGAAYAQAAAAQMNAETNRKLYYLESIRSNFQNEYTSRQTQLAYAQVQKTQAETDLTRYRADYQSMENQNYATYGAQQAYANVVKTTYEGEYLRAHKTESGSSTFRNIVSGASGLIDTIKGISSLASLFA